jgi:hypothetical protein
MKRFEIWIGALVLLIAAGMLLVPRCKRTAGAEPNPYEYDVTRYHAVDPAKVLYSEQERVPAVVASPHAIAVSASGSLYIGGAKEISRIMQNAKESFAVSAQVMAMALDEAGNLYAGFQDHIEVYDRNLVRKAEWISLGEKAIITSVAVGKTEVFVCDAGQKIVWKFSRAGALLGQIGGEAAGADAPHEFVIPSAYFDVVVSGDGLPWVVDPGRQKVRLFDAEGRKKAEWGSASMDWQGFCGCCNPSHIAILPGGGFGTAEKGLPRVKVYDAQGRWEGVVEAPDNFPADAEGLDVAVDGQGRIYVLVPAEGQVRIYVRKPLIGW